MHITFISFVALNELPQHGHWYFLVLDGFPVFGLIGELFQINLSADTIRKWQNPSNSGSRSHEYIRKLEEIFKVSLSKDTNDVSDDKSIPGFESTINIRLSHNTININIYPEAPEQE